MKKITLIVPAYNEEKRISSIAERLISDKYLRGNCAFLFVVDGNDRTAEIVRAVAKKEKDAEIEVAHYIERLGKGGAVGEGIKIAKTEYVGFVDADEGISATEIREMVALLLGKRLGCIIGKRMKVEGRGFRRALASKAFNLLVNALFGLGMQDTQCGCKFFRRELAYSDERPLFGIKGFAFDVELLRRIKKRGGKITEYGMVAKEGGGRFSLFESPGMFLDLLRLKFSKQY